MLSEQEIWVGTETKSELLIETSKEIVHCGEEKDDWEESDTESVAMVGVASSLIMECRSKVEA